MGDYIESFRHQMVSEGAAGGAIPAGTHLNREQRLASGGYLVPALSPVLIKDLLNMTSGLTYGGDSLAERETSRVIQEAIDRLDDKPMTTIEFAERIGECPLEFQPGSQMRYGLSADILGAVIEKVSGMSFGDFMKERLFDPLDMADTAFYVPDEKICERLSGRRVCESCGASYHVEHKPTKQEGICDSCGGKVVQRVDDKPETVLSRLATYHEKTAPLKDYYEERGKLKTVVGQDGIADTAKLTLEAIEG